MFSSVSLLKNLRILLVMVVVLMLSSAHLRSFAQSEPVVTEYAIPTDQSRPFGITVGSDGAMWFAEGDGNKIGRITMDGTISEFDIPTAESTPGLLTTGPDGAIWFVERDGNQIGRLTLDGHFSEFAIPTGGEQIQTASGKTVTTSTPQGIVSGPDNALWFTEQAGNNIGRITMDGKITEYPLPTADSGPLSIVVGGTFGQLWFTERSGNRIGRITTDGKIAEYTIPTADAGPTRIALGPDGDLWFCEFGAGKIGRIGPTGQIKEYPVSSGGPVGIAQGADGAMWFTEYSGNRIGRIAEDGQITEYPVPTDKSTPILIALGPDGAAWFTEQTGNNIGRLSTGSLSPVAFAWRTDGGVNRLGRPSSIVTDSKGNVYVVDSNNDRIQKFDTNGHFMTMWGSHGSGDGQFTFRILPSIRDAMTIDSHDVLYVVDVNGYVQKFDTDGKFLGKWGGGQGSKDGQFDAPQCMAVDQQGNFYIADNGESDTDAANRIQIFDPSGHLLATWNHSNNSQLGDVSCVAVDRQGNVYVANYTANRVQKFDAHGGLLTEWGSGGSGDGQFDGAASLAIDSHGNVYVGDNVGNRIEKFDSNGKFLGQWGSLGTGDGQFDYVFKLAVDKDDNVYVTSDGGFDRLQKFSPGVK